MLVLCNRFNRENVSTLRSNQTQTVSLGKLNLKQDGSLILDMNSCGSCGLGDGIYAYVGDEFGAWYVTYRDYFNGNPWVYCLLFNDSRLLVKGVIDENGTFFFVTDDKLMAMNRQGNMESVCSVGTVGSILEYDTENLPLTISRINRYISSLSNTGSVQRDVYASMILLHRLVDQIAGNNSLESISRYSLAKIIIETLSLAEVAGVNLQSEIIKQLRNYLQ